MTNTRYHTISNQPELYTPRLILRNINHKDAADLFECLSDELITSSMMHRTIKDMHEMEQKIEEYYVEYHSGCGIRLCAQERSSRKVIGSIMMYSVHNPTRAQIGFYINRAFWGCGFATEMVRAANTFAFEELEYNRIEAECYMENTASARVMERCGMVYEGLSRDYYCVNGIQKNVTHYAILKRDWEAMGHG